ncbi:MAG TPA: type II toxin-antitoxin system RelE/ParE family toxin [Candidatus Kapabacteria bacterium]|nr:type II toxin-antitoxin system RelE/ParE family toxin [Candidatus Kapabacteria bacterium]
MAKKEIVWSESAREDMHDIFNYISHQSLFYADTVIEQIIESAESLSSLSERGRVVPELRSPFIREIFVYQYRLLYKLSADSIEIIGILHMARDFANYQNEKSN